MKEATVVGGPIIPDVPIQIEMDILGQPIVAKSRDIAL